LFSLVSKDKEDKLLADKAKKNLRKTSPALWGQYKDLSVVFQPSK
jgi:hypothetical protein